MCIRDSACTVLEVQPDGRLVDTRTCIANALSLIHIYYPTLLGILFCSVFVVIIANVLTDFAYRFLDPKMRVGRR